jgi:hypothetical protein
MTSQTNSSLQKRYTNAVFDLFESDTQFYTGLVYEFTTLSDSSPTFLRTGFSVKTKFINDNVIKCIAVINGRCNKCLNNVECLELNKEIVYEFNGNINDFLNNIDNGHVYSIMKHTCTLAMNNVYEHYSQCSYGSPVDGKE